jgi:aerobic-type carbon monoxide dehydrogenase small subunit (CoxS/CutS family)
MRIDVSVNGKTLQRDVAPGVLLVDLLRKDLELIGTRIGCNNGICGSCTVLLDGEAVRSCLLLAVQADGASIVTIEGLSSVSPDGARNLDPLQAAFVEHGAVQCGFCIPGMIVTARGLLKSAPLATREDIVHALEGNLCRCTGYVKIVDAVIAASRSAT